MHKNSNCLDFPITFEMYYTVLYKTMYTKYKFQYTHLYLFVFSINWIVLRDEFLKELLCYLLLNLIWNKWVNIIKNSVNIINFCIIWKLFEFVREGKEGKTEIPRIAFYNHDFGQGRQRKKEERGRSRVFNSPPHCPTKYDECFLTPPY